VASSQKPARSLSQRASTFLNFCEIMQEEPQDEWVRVGGKGRPRRTPEQQQKHLQDRAAAAAALAARTCHSEDLQQQVCQTAAVHTQQQQQQQQASTPEQQQAAQQQLQALAAAMAGSTPPKQATLPGWGPPPEREWKVACSSRSRKNKKLQLPSTPAEQAQHVAKQVREIQGKLASSAVYASLLAAMRQAAPGLSEGCEDSSSIPAQQQQGSSSSSSGVCWRWGDVQQLVVYGLGSPDDSKVSRHQVGRGCAGCTRGDAAAADGCGVYMHSWQCCRAAVCSREGPRKGSLSLLHAI
jgi:hypothetical protein